MKAYAAVFCVVCAIGVQAQWVSQTVALQPGWNAVFLEVTPLSNACAAVFADPAIESVWAWNRRFQPMQFVRDPATLLPGQPEWLTWLPAAHPQAFLNNLWQVDGQRAYLIKCRDEVTPAPLVITGRAAVPSTTWYPDSFNLVGFFVEEQAPLSFAQLLAASSAHAGQPVYALDRAGHWQQVDAAATPVVRGQAYWIRCAGASTFTGPLQVSARGAKALDFSTMLSEQELRVKNVSASTRTVLLTQQASATPPAGAPALAGSVPLSYWLADPARMRFMWEPLQGTLTHTLAPGQEWVVQLLVRRPDMTASQGAGAEYQSLLQIRDSSGMQVLAPIMATRSATLDQALPRAGLWVGNVLLDQVSDVNGATTPSATPSPLRFRVIVHQDSNGVVRLLQHATVMLARTGATTNMVIVANDDLIPQYVPAQQDSTTVAGQRFSSVVFGFTQPQALQFNAATRILTTALTIDYNDRLSPFKHLYHPDHNNLDNYTTTLPQGVQSFTVTRTMTMAFSATPVGGASQAGWGDTFVGGVYREALDGLYHKTLNVQGTYVLQFVSPITTLLN
ncbi:MAG: hypothetical protein NTV22_13425 [bacterium]|nr:hypothetical protein [bacterium]